MTGLLSSFFNLPKPLQAASSLAAGGSVVAVVLLAMGGYTIVAAVILIGFAVLAGLLLLYRSILKWRQKVKAAPFVREIAESTSAVPQGAGGAAARASMDDMRKKFESGMATFRTHGKNIYALPWYVFVGEPGSGKTEAIRHCNIGFPPGLQNELQGTGGTINMDWWFTNHAVILDTAGKMVMADVDSPATSLWTEFLKLLARHRPNCPINGLLLAISAESLINDTAEAIEKKGGKLARQLDHIQRALGVRFPVFVVITKSDKINGFRDFFDDIGDPQMQHQIFGWSNPAPLDEEFKPDQVERCLQEIRTRLVRRRLALLRDPIHSEDEGGRRIDQIDSMYDFPNEIVNQLAPRLRRYLEMIFVAGTWATKPLFLRGIYFTSAMREGEELDKALANLYGVAVEALPGGRAWSRDKAYFLRDLFLNKVFREKGLVTRAGNTKKLQQRRRQALLATACGGLLLVGALTLWGVFALSKSVVEPGRFWGSVSKAMEPKHQRKILARVDDILVYGGDDRIEEKGEPIIVGEPATLAGAVARVHERAAENIKVHPIFYPANFASRQLLDSERHAAAEAFFSANVLQPLVEETRQGLHKQKQWGDRDAEVQALTELVRMEVAAEVEGPQEQPMALGPLLAYALRPTESDGGTGGEAAAADGESSDVIERDKALGDAESLQKTMNWLYGSAEDQLSLPWPPSDLGAGTKDARDGITRAIESFKTHAQSRYGGGVHGDVQRLVEQLSRFAEIERGLHAMSGQFETGNADALVREWNEKLAALQAAAKEIESNTANLGSSTLTDLNNQLLKRDKAILDGQLQNLRTALKPLNIPADDAGSAKSKHEPVDPFFVTVHRSIGEIQAFSPSAVQQEEIARRLREFDQIYLARAEEPSKRRLFEIRNHMYRLADDEIKRAASSGETKDLKAEIERFVRAGAAAMDGIRGDAAALTPLALREPATAVSTGAAALASRLATQNLAHSFLSSLPERATELAQMIKDQSDAASFPAGNDAGPRNELPEIPLTALAHNPAKRQLDAAYIQGAESSFLESWKTLTGLLKPVAPPAPEPLLDRAALKSAYDGKASAVNQYIDDYVNYWAVEVRNRSAIDFGSATTWEGEPGSAGIRDQLKTVKISDTNKNLKLVAERTRDALERVDQAALNEAARKTLEQIRCEIRTLTDSGFEKGCNTALDHWRSLNSFEQAKGTLLRSMNLDNTFFEVYQDECTSQTGAVRYWSDLGLKSLEMLANEGSASTLDAKKKLTAQASQKFPLCFSHSELSEAEFTDAQRWFQAIDAAAAGKAGADTDKTQWKLVNEQLRRLAGVGLFDQPTRDWILKTKPIFELFEKPKGEGFTCSLVVVSDDSLQRATPARLYLDDEAGRNEAVAAVGRFGFFKVKIGDAETADAIKTSGGDPLKIQQLKQDRFKLRLPQDQEVTFTFYEEAPSPGKPPAVRAVATLPKPWTGLGALRLTNDQYEGDGEKRVWRAPLRVVVEEGPGKGETYFYWIGLQFNRDVPKQDAWPQAKDWVGLSR